MLIRNKNKKKYRAETFDSAVYEIIDLEEQRKEAEEAYLVNKEQAEFLVNVSDKASGILGDGNTIVTEMHLIFNSIKDIALCIPAVRTIATICGIIHNFAKLLAGIFLNIHTSDKTPSSCRKAFGYYDITVAAIGIAVCIVAISIVSVAPYMMYLTFASDTIMNGWKFCHDIHKYFTKGKNLRSQLEDEK